MRVVIALASCAAVVFGAVSLHGQPSLIATDGLGAQAGFSSAELRLVDSGSAVIRSLDTSVREEVAYVGMVLIDAPAERFIELISITRSRNDGMSGLKGFFLRPIIRRRSSDAVRGYLDHVKQQVERTLPENLEAGGGSRFP